MASNHDEGALSDPITCCSCEGRVTGLKLLPCLHSVCGRCLAQQLDETLEGDAEDETRHFRCPADRKITTFRRTDVHSLPDDFLSNNYYDYYNIKKRGFVLCGNCRDSRLSAIAWCKRHALFLCESCLKLHAGADKSHSDEIHRTAELRRSGTDEAWSTLSRRSVQCHRHNIEASCFCQRCEELVCQKCIVEKHRDHLFRDPEEVISQFQEQFDGELKCAEEELQSTRDRVSRIDRRIESFKENHRSSEKLLEESYDELVAHIMAEKDRKKFELRRLYKIGIGAAEMERIKVSERVKQLENAVDVSRQARDKASAVEFLSVRKLLSGSLLETTNPLQCETSNTTKPEISVHVNQEIKANTMRSIAGLADITGSFSPSVQAPSAVFKDGQSVASVTHFGILSTGITIKATILDEEKAVVQYRVQPSNAYTTDILFRPTTTGVHALTVDITSPRYDPIHSEHRIKVLDNKPALTFGSFGSGIGQFSRPWGIACNADRNLLVVDFDNYRIQIANQSGDILDTISEVGCGVALTPNGRDIITVSQTEKKVHVNYHNYYREFTHDEFQLPCAVATDRQGRVYVADYDAGAIFVFTVDGTFIKQIGCKGKSPGQLQGPVNVTVNGQNDVAVCDIKGKCIQWYDARDRPLRKFASCWRSSQPFEKPRALCIDESGRMIVLDRKRVHQSHVSKIMVFTSDEKLISQIDGGENTKWECIAVSSDGHVFVTDYDKHVIHKYKYC